MSANDYYNTGGGQPQGQGGYYPPQGPPPGQGQGGYYPQQPQQSYQGGYGGPPPQGYGQPYQPQPQPQTVYVQQAPQKDSGSSGTCMACMAGILCCCCAEEICDCLF